MAPEKYTSLTFELHGEHDMFKLEGTKLLTKGPLDRETKDFYNITVCFCKKNIGLNITYHNLTIIYFLSGKNTEQRRAYRRAFTKTNNNYS